MDLAFVLLTVTIWSVSAVLRRSGQSLPDVKLLAEYRQITNTGMIITSVISQTMKAIPTAKREVATTSEA